MSKKENPPPVHRIQLRAVSASIWRNETKKGSMFNVAFQRTYKDGDDWKNSTSYGQRDLLVLGLVSARAFEWIAAQSQKPKPSAAAQRQPDDVPY